MRSTRRVGIAIVELLIVIAILQLLLLAVQKRTRSGPLRTECGNNLRQIAVAFQLHESAHRHFPTGG